MDFIFHCNLAPAAQASTLGGSLVMLADGNESKNMTMHKNELINTISKLDAGHSGIQNLSYFFKVALKFSFEIESRNAAPQVAIVGMGIPEELIYAAGAEPLWILGGSFGAAQSVDHLVPRDTDSVSKATLGYLFSEIFTFTEKAALTVIPITSDSMRKIAYMLSQKREVLAIDIPPVKGDPQSPRKWLAQMDHLRTTVERKTRRKVSLANLRTAVTLVNQAKMQMKRILAYSINYPELISGVLAMFVLNTYYFTNQLSDWIAHLKALNNEIAAQIGPQAGSDRQQRPRVMLAGSPVFFPYYKIPLLLQELNLYLSAYAQEMTRRIDIMPEVPRTGGQLSKILENIVLSHYWADCSAAFVDSKSRRDYMMALAKAIPLNGVIYHVLKGQIEYDFELEQCEYFFGQLDIPVFRLETDFHGQDIEQLKIRMEAFTEMINAKYFNMRARIC
jgi:benzoyl-CoA reductase/2-hydroxyglutaryl-CoA dehydratase subunit BcrC/BadD/HgdB